MLPLEDNNVGDVNFREKTESQWQKPVFLGRRKRSLENNSSKSDSDVVQGSTNALEQGKQFSCFSTSKLQDCASEVHTTVKEWNALFTAQITQKSKKYNDGILRLIHCGSNMNQVILLNEDCTELSSKYLRSVECVETGCDYQLPNYLVQICEPRNHPVDIKNKHLGQVDCEGPDDARSMDITMKTTHEWTALYTTQKTQKMKKYHDGILRRVNCGSQMKQIVLLNEEGEVLNSRYLKSTELVEIGQTYEFPSYLVEVCELKVPIGDNIPKGSVEQVANCRSSKKDRITSNCRVAGDKSMLNGIIYV